MRKLVVLGLLGVLASCGDSTKKVAEGADADLPQTTPGAISGTAAVGAPMADARIVIKGEGCVKEGKSNSKGVYSVGVSGCAGPYLLSAESALGKFHSVATQEDVGAFVNVTPLTQVVAARALQTTNFASFTASSLTKEKISSAVEEIKEALSGLMSAFDAADVDLRSGAFAANGSKLDKVLDAISVSATSTQVEIAVKGSTAKVEVPASSSAITGAIDAAAVEAAEQTMTEFDKIKKDLLGGINSCLRQGAAGQNCYFGHFHEYLNDGLTIQEEWEDIAYSGMDLSFNNPVLIEFDKANNFAWVSVQAREKDKYDGRYNSWLVFNRIEKVDGIWKIIGNKFPHKFYPQSSVVVENGEVKKAINFRSWASYSEEEDAVTFEFNSSDLGLATDAVTGSFEVTGYEGEFYGNASVTNGVKPACATNNSVYECDKMFLVPEAKDVAFNRYTITIGSESFSGVIPSLPSATQVQDIPGFTNLSGNICEAPGTAPQNLQWRLPSGFFLEDGHYGFSIFQGDEEVNPIMEDQDNENRLATSMPFLSALEYDPAIALEIRYFSLMFEFRDSDERAYFLPYGCSSSIP